MIAVGPGTATQPRWNARSPCSAKPGDIVAFARNQGYEFPLDDENGDEQVYRMLNEQFVMGRDPAGLLEQSPLLTGLDGKLLQMRPGSPCDQRRRRAATRHGCACSTSRRASSIRFVTRSKTDLEEMRSRRSWRLINMQLRAVYFLPGVSVVSGHHPLFIRRRSRIGRSTSSRCSSGIEQMERRTSTSTSPDRVVREVLQALAISYRVRVPDAPVKQDPQRRNVEPPVKIVSASRRDRGWQARDRRLPRSSGLAMARPQTSPVPVRSRSRSTLTRRRDAPPIGDASSEALAMFRQAAQRLFRRRPENPSMLRPRVAYVEALKRLSAEATEVIYGRISKAHASYVAWRNVDRAREPSRDLRNARPSARRASAVVRLQLPR